MKELSNLAPLWKGLEKRELVLGVDHRISVNECKLPDSTTSKLSFTVLLLHYQRQLGCGFENNKHKQ